MAFWSSESLPFFWGGGFAFLSFLNCQHPAACSIRLGRAVTKKSDMEVNFFLDSSAVVARFGSVVLEIGDGLGILVIVCQLLPGTCVYLGDRKSVV